MKSSKFILLAPFVFGLTLFTVYSSHAGTSVDFVAVGSVAYSGELSPSELMSEEYHRISSLDAEAEISFKVSVPIIEKGRVLVENTDGLPLADGALNSPATEARITIPFSTTEFEAGEGLDHSSFEAAVDDTLRNLKQIEVPDSSNRDNSKNSRAQSGALNQGNCGGYPLGTQVTVRTDSCLVDSTINEYTCTANPITGGKDWFLTSSQWVPPSTTECFPGGN